MARCLLWSDSMGGCAAASTLHAAAAQQLLLPLAKLLGCIMRGEALLQQDSSMQSGDEPELPKCRAGGLPKLGIR